MANSKGRKKIELGSVAVDTATNVALGVGGWLTGELVANKVGEQVAQLNTPMAQTGLKAIMGIGLAYAAFKNKKYKSELLAVAGGVAFGAGKDLAFKYLPGDYTAPAIAGHSTRVIPMHAGRAAYGGGASQNRVVVI